VGAAGRPGSQGPPVSCDILLFGIACLGNIGGTRDNNKTSEGRGWWEIKKLGGPSVCYKLVWLPQRFETLRLRLSTVGSKLGAREFVE